MSLKHRRNLTSSQSLQTLSQNQKNLIKGSDLESKLSTLRSWVQNKDVIGQMKDLSFQSKNKG